MSSYTFASPPSDPSYGYDTKAFQGLHGLNRASFSVNHILDLEELPKNHAMFSQPPNMDTPHVDMGVNMGSGPPTNPCILISPTHTDEQQKSPIGKSNNPP
jgi:hypothetical protein